MNVKVTSALHVAAIVAVSAVVAVEPAFAGRVVPAPIIGLGAPVFALLGAGYWAVQRIRNR